MYDRTYTYYREASKLYLGEICDPRMAIIYVSNACNFSCEGCLCEAYHTQKALMDFCKFQDLTVQLKKHGVESIEFCGGGEPLLHPDINKMITWVTDQLHLSLGVMTNGSLLNDQLNYLLATRSNYVRVSLYDHSYESVLKKVIKLIDAKKKTAGSTIIGAKFLVNSENQDLVFSRINEVIKIPGINHISVKARRGYNEECDYSSLENRINDLNDKRISANLEKTKLIGRCWMSPIHTLIDPIGDVYICCYYMDREKEHCIGNVFEKPFSDIWGKPEHIKNLRSINYEKCNIFDCRWHNYNKKMSDLLNHDMLHLFC